MPRLALLLLAALPGLAADPPKPLPGEAMIEKYLRAKVEGIAADPLKGVTTKAEWEKRRPELRKQFLGMMGLEPLPEPTKLNATITGTADGEGFTVEKLVFESRPGLFVTANVYVPKRANPDRKGGGETKYPTVLYLCGHGNVVEDGVSYGSKAYYQYHPAWFAAHGYVCLVLDTLQLGEIPGEHHGTYKLNRWWWQSWGFTPGGVELWNAMRALDYLETRPDVDAKKIGVTGRSGGGATTWWLMAADDRPVCANPVAGITDLFAHVCQGQTDKLRTGVIAGHCDCMYMVNSEKWDFPLVAALAAPRPILLGNSDADDIFPVDGYRRLSKSVAKVYEWYDATDHFQLQETKGPHADTPEFRIGTNKWMNRWLKGDAKTPVEDDLPPKLKPAQLKVLDKTPEGALNARIPEAFLPLAKIELPAKEADVKAWWPKKREGIRKELTATSFKAWPQKPDAVSLELLSKTGGWGVQSWLYQFESEPGVVVPMQVLTSNGGPGGDTVSKVRLVVAGATPVTTDLQAGEAVAVVYPRGVGPTRWAEPGSTTETHIRRRFPLVGQTLEGGRVWDVRRAVQALSALRGVSTVQERVIEWEVELAGSGPEAGIALYAALYEPAVKTLTLTNPPTSFRHPDSPAFLGAAKILDHPHALAVAAAGRSVSLTVPAADANAWDWAVRVQHLSGGTPIAVTPVGK